MKEVIFGNQEQFAIRYIVGYKSEAENYYYAFLHLILGGQIIGDPEEECFLPTWLNGIKRIKSEIINRNILKWKETDNKPDNEVLESNSLTIDETIDGWLISLIEEKENLKFIWKGLRNPCPKERIGEIYTVDVKREKVIDVIKECIATIEKELKSYPIKNNAC